MNDARLGDFLVKIGLITPAQLHTAREMVEASGGKGKLANVVTSLGFASAEELARLAATALRLPYVALDKVNIPKPLVGMLSKEHARKAKGILVKAEGKKFYLATFDPTNVIAFDELQFVLGGRIFPVVATEEEVTKAFGHYYTERIQYDRPFDLPKSDTLDFDKAEVFDIRTARAKKQENKSQVDLSAKPATANRKAAEDKLAAAASTVKKVRPPEPVAPAALRSPAIEIRDEAVEELPTIRDASELTASPSHQAEEELEVVEVDDAEVADQVEILDADGAADAAEITLEGELEPVDEDVSVPAAAASADDLLSLFGAMAFGVEPSTSPKPIASAETDELAKLFMGALGAPAAPAEAGAPEQPADMHQANELAKELAQMLLEQ